MKDVEQLDNGTYVDSQTHASVAASEVMPNRLMQVELPLVELDECRTKNRSEPGSRGLAPPPEAEGLMSIYSAGIGQSAWDRLDANKLFGRPFASIEWPSAF